MKIDNETLEKLKKASKKGTCLLVAATCVASLLTGCSNTNYNENATDNINETSVNDDQNIISESIYSTQNLTNYELWKIKTPEEKEIFILVEPRISYGLFYNDLIITEFMSGNEIINVRKDAADPDKELWNEAISQFETKIGKIVSKQGFYPLLVEKYGSKKEYTKSEIKQIMDELNGIKNKEEIENSNKEYNVGNIVKYEIWTVKEKDRVQVPIIVEPRISYGLFYNDLIITEFMSGNEIINVRKDAAVPDKELWNEAISQFETKIGKIVSKQGFYPLLVEKFGTKSTYTIEEINLVLNDFKERLKKNNEELDVNESKINCNEDVTKNEETTIEVKELTIDELLNNSISKSEAFNFCPQDILYDSKEFSEKELYSNLQKVSYVKELTYQDGSKYLINNDENMILLSDYDNLGKEFILIDYHVFVDEDKFEKPGIFSKGYVVEIIKDNKKYLVDASDFTKILAEGYLNYETYLNKCDDEMLKLTYADNRVEDIMVRTMEPYSSNVLVK